MDIGFEGGFKILKCSLNTNMHPAWVEKEDEKYYYLKNTIFETVFANDIVDCAKAAWVDYFSKKHGNAVAERYIIRSIVDVVKDYKEGKSNIFPKDIDIVTGGFPCQDFSVAGKRKGFHSEVGHNGQKAEGDSPSEETRGKLYMWMKEVVEITKPKIFIAEKEIKLTQTEYNIVSFLSEHCGKVMTYAAIIKAIWREYPNEAGIKKLQVNMANVRKKFGAHPGESSYIENELGIGYRMKG